MSHTLSRADVEELALGWLRDYKANPAFNRDTRIAGELDSLGHMKWFMGIENGAERQFGVSVVIAQEDIYKNLAPFFELGNGVCEDALADVTVGEIIDEIVSQLVPAPAVDSPATA